MGIQNRDYFRDERRSWREQWLTPGCKWLIIVTVVVFVLQIVVTGQARFPGGYRPSLVSEALELDPARVAHGEIWRLVTYAFCHEPGNPWHILFNMLFLAWFGKTLERMYGTREFVFFYLAAAFFSGAAFFALALIFGDKAPAIGASGAVMAVVMVYAIHFPREEIFLFGLFRVQIRFLVLFYLIFDLFPVLQALGGDRRSDGVAHSAHLGGLAFGYLYNRFGLRLDRMTAGLKPFARLRRLRVGKQQEAIRIYEPPTEPKAENLDLQVDAILEKILAQGEKSLTEKERDLLRRASERYKENQRNR